MLHLKEMYIFYSSPFQKQQELCIESAHIQMLNDDYITTLADDIVYIPFFNSESLHGLLI